MTIETQVEGMLHDPCRFKPIMDFREAVLYMGPVALQKAVGLGLELRQIFR